MKMAHGSSLSEETISLSEYACELVINDKRRYLATTEVDPYCIPFAELNKDNLPPVQCTDIFNYLVLDKSFCTSQRFKAFKSMKAYKYFWHKKIQEELCYSSKGKNSYEARQKAKVYKLFI